MPTASVQHVTVIGAGPGGLSAAVLLAASGFRVRVFESRDTIGGRTTRFTDRAGDDTFHFDCGPTFFLMPYVLEEVFAAAGRSLADYVDLRRLDPMYRLMLGRPGKDPIVLDATQNIEEMSRRIAQINPADGAQFSRFINDNRYKLRHSESILRNPMRTPLDLFAPATLIDTIKVGPVLNPHLSVHDLLSRYFTDPQVRLAVSFQSKYLGMSPYDCPSLFTILPFIEYEYGIWHPIGGCHALMQALARLAQELGVEITTNAPVEAIEFEGTLGRAVVVRGERHPTDHVVVNADAVWAMKKFIPEDLRQGWRPVGGSYDNTTLDDKKYSCSTFMLYLGVEGEIDLPHHTICVSSRYEGNLDEITNKGSLSEDPSVYVCNPSRLDPTLAPKGKSSLYVLVPCPNLKQSAAAKSQGRDHADWTRDAGEVRRRTFQQLDRVLGLRDLEKRVRTERMYTPLDWQGMNINFGATFNLAHNLGQMLHRRPQNKLPFTDNVYLVGGGTHPGSGLPTIFLSSQISVRMLCERVGVPFAGNTEKVREIARARGLPPLSPV